MKVVHLNNSSNGGAAKAAIRLHMFLLEHGIESKFFYLYGPEIETTGCERINVQYSILDRILFKLKIKKHLWEKGEYINCKKKHDDIPFSICFRDFSIKKAVQFKEIINTDILHLHTVNNIVQFSDFKNKLYNKNIVWTLHDMNPFTGGCHYSFNCNEFIFECNKCPQIKENYRFYGLIKSELKKKIKYISNTKAVIIPLNMWMKNQSEKSMVFKNLKHKYVQNSIDTELYSYINKKEDLKKNANLSQQKFTIGYVATYHSKLKGTDIFLELINKIDDNRFQFLYIGEKFDIDSKNLVHLGNLSKETELNNFYNTIDLLLVPSRADNLPNVILESHCAGTPVLASNVGGIPEMIDNSNGKLVHEYEEINSWIEQVNKIAISDMFSHTVISKNAKARYSPYRQVESIIKVYHEFNNKQYRGIN